jgi:hypothetical protein
MGSMRSMRSMRGGFIFRNWGPSLKVHHCQHLASVTKHDTGGCMCCMRSTRGEVISVLGGPRCKKMLQHDEFTLQHDAATR